MMPMVHHAQMIVCSGRLGAMAFGWGGHGQDGCWDAGDHRNGNGEGRRVWRAAMRAPWEAGRVQLQGGELSGTSGRVLSGNQLSGSIPSSIGNLTALTKL